MLRTRVITALVLLALILPAIIFDPPLLWSLLALAFLALAAFEWNQLRAGVNAGGSQASLRFAVLVFSSGLAWLLIDAVWPLLADRLALILMAVAAVFWIVAAPWRLRSLPLSAGPAALAMLVLLACWLALVELRAIGPLALFAAMGVVWLADIGAYFVGRGFGRRKLAPAISPGKSWEGVYGGMFCVVIVSLVAAAAPALDTTLPARLVGLAGPIVAVVVMSLLSLLSVIGDLYESALKRSAGVKDSGKTLPGHGGVLDRVDGLIPVMPCIALLHRVLQ